MTRQMKLKWKENHCFINYEIYLQVYNSYNQIKFCYIKHHTRHLLISDYSVIFRKERIQIYSAILLHCIVLCLLGGLFLLVLLFLHLYGLFYGIFPLMIIAFLWVRWKTTKQTNKKQNQ